SKNSPRLPLPRSLALTKLGFGKMFPVVDSFGVVESCSSFDLVGVPGFEPGTLRLSSACSNQLSYTPEPDRAVWPVDPELVELRRFELLTYSLQSYRSTN